MAVTWINGPKTLGAGSRRMVTGKLTISAAAENIVTGLRWIDSIITQGFDTTDNSINVSRNTTTTTDNAGDAGGTAHIASAAAPASYCIVAIGR